MKFLIFCALITVATCQRVGIPPNLVHCYRGNESQPWISNSLPLVIELIRKVEAFYPTSIDMRQLSVKLFHDLRVDGIERAQGLLETEDVTPFSQNGIMVPKFRVLLQLISNVPGVIDFARILTPSELCMLHKMISSSVEPFERRNEIRVCPKDALNLNQNWKKVNTWMPENRHSLTNNTILPPTLSRCPLERGIVNNEYGTIHPGIFIAAVASGLQPQNVRISDFVAEYQRKKDPYEHLETMEGKLSSNKKIQHLISSLDSVDNTYASGLVGDLAEVVLYQAPFVGRNLSVGLPGSWNDTNFPREFYLHGNRRGHWQMTDSEILSGIDGIFVSQQISAWTARIRRMRLSQIMEMYYLHQGISVPTIENNLKNKFYKGRPSKKTPNEKDDEETYIFNGHKDFKKMFQHKKLNDEIMDVEIKYLSRFSVADGITSVCHRMKILEMIDVDKLKEETYNFAQILEVESSNLIISEALLKSFSNSAVDLLVEHARELITKSPECQKIQEDNRRTAIDLTIIIDGSRTAYENFRLISVLAESADVGTFGSYISVIHGSTGDYIVNRTNSLASMFEQLRNNSLANPIQLSLAKSLGSLLWRLSNQTEREKGTGVYGELSKVCLIFSQSHRISEQDFNSGSRLLQGSMQQFPDLYFVFVSNDIGSFTEMTGDERQRNTNARIQIQDSERYYYVSTNSIALSSFHKTLKLVLSSIPKRIISPFCKTNDKTLWNDEGMIRDEFEEYLIPNEEIRMRISPFYLRNSEEIRIKFQGVGYGDFSVCMSRNRELSSKQCQSVENMNYAWFNMTNPCETENAVDGCNSIYFALQMDTTFMKCSESDCRFPDQVRIIIRPEGLRCEYNASNKLTVSFMVIFISFFISLHNKFAGINI